MGTVRTVVRGLSGLVLALLLQGCSAGSSARAPGASGTAGPHSPGPQSPGAPSSAQAASPGPGSSTDRTTPGTTACRPGPGRHISLLPDVTVPPVPIPPVSDPTTGAQLAPGATVPGQVIDAGCVIRHTAPGGCVGAITITGATIPPVVIPGVTANGHDYPSLTIPGASRPAVHAAEVCQVRRQGRLATVTRAGVVREGFSRSGGARPGDALVPTVRVPAVRLPAVDVDPVRLERRDVGARVSELAGAGRVSYVAPAAVLFGKDRADLRASATTALRLIARRIGATAPGRPLLIEGHTDDLGSAAHGLVLSRQRADAVADWLVAHAGFARSAITTKGWGEAKPAYPNDSPAHRARNRRVVITVLPRRP